MNRIRNWGLAALLLTVGYGMGASGVALQFSYAQEEAPEVSEDAVRRIQEVQRRLSDAVEALRSQGRYETITQGVNSFLVLSGGGNAREDLESGRGVDPETFAGLYAGQATPEIQALLGVDDQGRITYNNEVVRMYSKSRLERIFASRTKINETF